MRRLCAGLVLLVLSTAQSQAHGINIELHGDGDASVVFHYTDGSLMAGAEYRVFAPNGGGFSVATGKTTAAGEVPLRATSDGRWRIEVRDDAGHTGEARVDVTRGMPGLAGQRIPDWFVALSVFLNVLLALALFVRRGAHAPSTRRGVPS